MEDLDGKRIGCYLPSSQTLLLMDVAQNRFQSYVVPIMGIKHPVLWSAEPITAQINLGKELVPSGASLEYPAAEARPMKLVVSDVDYEFSDFNPRMRLLLVEQRMGTGANVDAVDLKFFLQDSTQYLGRRTAGGFWELMKHRAVFLGKAEKAQAACCGNSFELFSFNHVSHRCNSLIRKHGDGEIANGST